VAAAGAGLGLYSVASTALGTTVPAKLRGTASGIINTAAQLGTAIGSWMTLNCRSDCLVHSPPSCDASLVRRVPGADARSL
jgi:hypothetical protein